MSAPLAIQLLLPEMGNWSSCSGKEAHGESRKSRIEDWWPGACHCMRKMQPAVYDTRLLACLEAFLHSSLHGRHALER